MKALDRRLARLENLRRSGKPLPGGYPGLSALLAVLPVRTFASTPTPSESAWMREHGDLIAKRCPIRPATSLGGMLDAGRERIRCVRELMAAESPDHV